MHKRNVSLRRFFYAPKTYVRKGETDNGHLGGYIYSCQPPYNSNFRSFKIKPLVPRSSNLRDSLLGENDSGLNSRLKSFTKRENFDFLKYSK